MRGAWPVLTCLVFLPTLALLSVLLENEDRTKAEGRAENNKLKPSQAAAWRWSFPDDTWNPSEADLAAREISDWRAGFQTEHSSEQRQAQGLWRLEGPTNIGGRLNFVRQHPLDSSLIFAGTAAGGLWSTYGGFSSDGSFEAWSPLTDGMDRLAMGSIAFHPTDTNVIYLGTGDPQISSHPRIGGGVFKSENRGETWAYSGCEEGRIVSRLLVFDESPDTVIAAVMGNPAFNDEQRGIYRTTDGGSSWQQTLTPQTGLGSGTGVNDVARSDSTGTVIAAAWTRQRTSWNSVVSGVDCRIHRSIDGGSTWEPVDNPWPEAAQGRIGLTQTSGIFWALVVGVDHQLHQVYRSDDDGISWSPIIAEFGINWSALGGFGWYFSKIIVNPWNTDDLTLLGVDIWNSTDGGAYWELMAPEWYTYEVHADKHDFQWTGPETAVLATDGGAYRTTNHGETWQDIEDLPVSQFYRATANPWAPGLYTGGLQDNGTTSGNHLAPGNWSRDRGGDGFTAAFHSENPLLRYSTVQNGAFAYSTSDPNEPGFTSYDWQNLTAGFEVDDRFWWDAPIMLHPANPDQLWSATQRVYTMTAPPTGTWTPVSEDLTEAAEDSSIAGLKWRAVTALGGSHFDEEIVAAGTSDGRLWLTTDGGSTWSTMMEGLPERYITSVVFDPYHADSMFCTLSGYRDAVYTSHVFGAAIGGAWSDLSGDLPDHPANHIATLNDSTWALATDFGVYWTQSFGVHWEPIAAGEGPGLMPMVPVYELDIDWGVEPDSSSSERRLVAATFARSLHSFPLDSLLPFAAPEPDAVAEVRPIMPFYIEAHPSPFVDHLNVQCTPGQQWASLDVFDAQGRFVEKHNAAANIRLTTAHWPSGVYIVRGESPSGTVATLKAIKR
jgi:hypothetical protein